ncbi:molybdate transport system permease protein [Cupriavidus metallidurans]|jgi:molybdate transport system permease protein|uniref:Molybdenum transport system permease n=2 Tax=Cupriavidus metallidurans TaxID=119219 RepID=Q1LQX0_CUPMC|nr:MULTISPECIES: molybdate ABC transporter permease subunit [Cupriavidus]HBD38896.1 molybdate ABC transporter permease subunit [Cupriavidus sp.]ABF07456.1 molybdate transporter subunit; membrane component of ABC superfamily [Cupriavidus metallidurans CH34]AVA32701.1 molybdate ABC transporter permease subunit [Cupriavidus metallidurans]ELA01386.1 MolT family ABC transporter permease [Cupriavidus sp. HMR-1]KWR83436.1 molybdenum ABC transporter permease [Cupriavidus sp. SHE]
MDAVWVPLLLSLKVAGWATLLNAILGVAAAYAISRWRSSARDVVDAILTLPLVLPPTVLGYYLLVLVGRRGVFGAWLDRIGIELVFTWQGAVLASTVVAFPLVLKSARAAFEGVDHQLENAARVLGVSETGIFFRVTLPMALRGISAGVVLAFARALGEFGATLMVAGNLPGRTQTLSVAIYEAVQAGDDNTANLLVLVTSVTCIVLLVVAGRLVPPAARGVGEVYERRAFRREAVGK